VLSASRRRSPDELTSGRGFTLGPDRQPAEARGATLGARTHGRMSIHGMDQPLLRTACEEEERIAFTRER
jgi:hypothetical protein